jgi:hypothetical protein
MPTVLRRVLSRGYGNACAAVICRKHAAMRMLQARLVVLLHLLVLGPVVLVCWAC